VEQQQGRRTGSRQQQRQLCVFSFKIRRLREKELSHLPMSDLVRVHLGGGFADPPHGGGGASAGQRSVNVATGNEKRAVFCKGSDIMAGPVFKGMDAYSIHKAFINNYVTAAGRAPPSGAQAHHRTDADILRSTFRPVYNREPLCL
jgi:hypothetical protein